MNKIKILLAAFALVAAGTVSAQSLTDINTKFSDAAAAMQGKDYAKAAVLFEQIVDEGMDVEGADDLVAGAKKYLPQAIFRNGGAQFQAGNMDAALADFAKAADIAELYGDVTTLNNARTWVGRTVMKQGADAFNSQDYATAAAIFQKGYDANPNDTGVALNLAASYSGMKEYAKSNEIYKNIIALEGQHSRFEEAVAEAKQKFTEDNLVRASENAQAKAYDEALVALDEVLAVIPASPEATMLRLQTYNNMKNYDKVIEVGEAAVEAQTSGELKSNANFLIGAAYQNKQNYAKAVEYYQKVVEGSNAPAAKAQITELQKLIK